MYQSGAYETRRLRLLAEETQGPDVLDLGYAQLPNPFLGNFRVVGFDLAPPRGEVSYAETIQGDCMDIERVLAGRQFDTILCGELIEHLEEPYRFLRQLKKLLKPGGRLVLSTPNPLGFPVIGCEMLQTERIFYTTDHTFYFLPRWVKRMLVNSGFQLERMRPVGIWLPGFVIPWSPIWMSYQVVYIAH